MQTSIKLDDIFFSNDPLQEHTELLQFEDTKNVYWMLTGGCKEESADNDDKNVKLMTGYTDNDDDLVNYEDTDGQCEIAPIGDGKYSAKFHVPVALHAGLIGRGGKIVRDLESRSRTRIRISKESISGTNKFGSVTLTGNSEKDVAYAHSKILLNIQQQRDRLPMTHFLSVRVCTDEIRENFQKFQSDILSWQNTKGIDNTIFQLADRLHLTLNTLTLLDEDEVDKAKQIFLDFNRNILQDLIQDERILITLKGVDTMNDDPSSVDVLYAKVNFDNGNSFGIINQLYEQLTNLYNKNDFTQKQFPKLKMHATLMNSRYRASDEACISNRTTCNNSRSSNNHNQHRNVNVRQSFDATEILRKYKGYYFGKVAVDAIDLSIRTELDEDGYYKAVVSVKI